MTVEQWAAAFLGVVMYPYIKRVVKRGWCWLRHQRHWREMLWDDGTHGWECTSCKETW
jgi:hypothetical protein